MNRDVVFLFGAGASAFSNKCLLLRKNVEKIKEITGSEATYSVFPKLPPLGEKLFDVLLETDLLPKNFPTELIPLFQNKNGSFEKGMAELNDREAWIYSSFIRRFCLLLAAYECDFDNLYLNLTLYLRNHLNKIVFSSLNYDILVPDAIAKLGKNCSLYSKNGAALYMPLHGVSTFIPDYGNNVIEGCHFQGQRKSDIETPIIFENFDGLVRWCKKDTNAVGPAVAMYMKGKRVATSGRFIEGIRSKWENLLQGAKLCFIIGVFCNEEDSHIWNVLAKTPANIMYVDPKPKNFIKWALNNRTVNTWDTYPNTFYKEKGLDYYKKNTFENALPKIIDDVHAFYQ